MNPNEVEQMAYGLLAIAGNDDAMRKRLDELVKAREAIEQERATLTDARDAADRAKAESAVTLQRHKTELAAAKAEHDASAEESAARIRVGNEQAAELMRIKKTLDDREHDLSKRENEMRDHVLHTRQMEHDAARDREDAAAIKAEYNERIAKLREIIG